MRSFLPYTVVIFLMFLAISLSAPWIGQPLPQPWWTIEFFGSWALMVWSMKSKERWLS